MHPLLLHLLILLFATSAWLSINSIYVELPVLVPIVPESWNFATYVVVLIQLSCIFPFIYSIIRMWKPTNTSSIEPVLVIALLVIDVIGLVMTTFTYKSTTIVDGVEHSVLLFLSIFILCIPCTMADVVFLPFIGTLGPSSFITTFYIGMGVGALIPSLLSFAQNPSETSSNFSFPIFIYIICIFVFISCIAYIILLIYNRNMPVEQDTVTVKERENSTDSLPITFPLTVSLVGGALQNAILPSILSYAASPFGGQTYSLSTTLFVLTNPLFCFIQHFYSFSSSLHLSLLSIFILFPIAFIVTLSLVPLNVPSVLLPISSALSAGLLSLLRTASASRLASSSHPRALFFCGASTQFGSFIGALSIFVLANILHIFVSS